MPFFRPVSGQPRAIATRARKSAAARSNAVENLEQRSLMSVSVGSDGFTDVVKSSDSKVIYVSSTGGSDSNSGTTADSPVKSISKGMSLMRSGSPDHLLLKRGDSWTEKLSWGKSGRSAQEPAYLGAYGSGSRPMIKAGSGNAIEVTSGSVNHLVIQGIHLFAHNRDPQASGYSRNTGGYGIRWVGGTQGLLVEDTVIDQFKFNILIQPYNSSLNNVKLRRNVITDAYSGDGSHSSGIYAQGINGLTLEENVFDHNGWHDSIGGQSPQNHNAYLSEGNSNVKVIGNVFANASSHGLQSRAGGEVRDNLFIKNPIHMSFGLVNGAPLKPGGVSGTVDGNVFLEGRLLGGSARGWAIELGNITSATVRNNIMNDDGPGQAGAIMLGVGTNLHNAGSGVGINNLTIEDNVVNKWHMAFEMSGSLNVGGSGNSSLNNLTVRDNDFQNAEGQYNRLVSHISTLSTGEESWSNNRYYDEADSSKWYFVGSNTMSMSTWKSRLESTAQSVKVNYSNPNASISSYAGSYQSFMSRVRGQSADNWSGGPAKGAVAYMRGAFNKGASTSPLPTPTPTPTPTPAPTPTPTPTPPSTSDTTQPALIGYSVSATSASFRFSERVSSSVSASDLIVKSSSGSTISSGSMSVSYNTTTNVATWTFPGLSGDKLASGTYQLKLPDQNITDAAGNRLAGSADVTIDFNTSSPKTWGDMGATSIPAPTPTPTPTLPPVGIDTTNPVVVSKSGNSTSVKIKFSENVKSSLVANDLTIRKSNGTTVTGLSLSYDTSTNEATWTWSYNGGRLSSGTWQVKLPDQNVLDAAGNRLGGGADLAFNITV